MTIEELQSRMSSREFEVWRVLDRRGELPDDWTRVGVIAAAVANFSGFSRPARTVSADDFRPKRTTPEQEEAKQIAAFESLVKPPDYSEFIWKT
jgi:hypothetical protein